MKRPRKPATGRSDTTPILPDDKVVLNENWEGFCGLYLDEQLNMIIGGDGVAMGVRLTPLGALQLAERLIGIASAAIATEGLASEPPAGNA